MSDEEVLVVPTRLLHACGLFQGLSRDADRYAPLFQAGAAHFLPRPQAEEDPSYKQLIPYVVLRCDERVFHYRRSAKGTEARLHALRSVGVGGHINPADHHASDDTFTAALLRELAEEVELPPGPPRLTPLGLINDDATPVGQVHLGVVYVLELPTPDVRPREAAFIEPGFATPAELWAERELFETWSQFVLAELR